MKTRQGFVTSASALSSIITKDNTIKLRGSEDDNYWPITLLNEQSIDKELDLASEIVELRKKLFKLHKETDKDIKNEINDLSVKLARKELKMDLLERGSSLFRKYVLSSDNIFNHIDVNRDITAAVLSMDIRKSTFMMTKASKNAFAEFLTNIIQEMTQIIKNNEGIFEKFTGDGFISIFLEDYLVDNCIPRAIKCAQQCRDYFEQSMLKKSVIFDSIIQDFGCSFGIDYGVLSVGIINSELNVIGSPVVYACRMSAGKKNEIILNNKAKVVMEQHHAIDIKVKKKIVKIKNEPDYIGYRVITDISDEPFPEVMYH